MRAYDGIKAERGIHLESPDFLERSRQMLAKNNSMQIFMSGGSMRPTIQDGDLVTIEAISDGKVNQGDIVLFESRFETAVIHRVIKIERIAGKKTITTRGDASTQNDCSIVVTNILGRVKNIERAGESIHVARPHKTLSIWLQSIWKRLKFWRVE
ncbi:MAG: signal peptidase I [Acidobacteriota bacterium]